MSTMVIENILVKVKKGEMTVSEGAWFVSRLDENTTLAKLHSRDREAKEPRQAEPSRFVLWTALTRLMTGHNVLING